MISYNVSRFGFLSSVPCVSGLVIHFTSALAAATDQVALSYPGKNRHDHEATIGP